MYNLKLPYKHLVSHVHCGSALPLATAELSRACALGLDLTPVTRPENLTPPCVIENNLSFNTPRYFCLSPSAHNQSSHSVSIRACRLAAQRHNRRSSDLTPCRGWIGIKRRPVSLHLWWSPRHPSIYLYSPSFSLHLRRASHPASYASLPRLHSAMMSTPISL